MKSIKLLILLFFGLQSSNLLAQNPPFVFNLPFDNSVVDWGTRNLTIHKTNVAFGFDRFGGANNGLWLKNDSTFSAYVDISDSIKLNDTAQLTYSLYFKPSTTSIANQMVLLDKGYDNGGWQLILTKSTAGSGSISIRTLSNSLTIASSLTYGAWHHVYVQTQVNAGVVVINTQLDTSGTPVTSLFPISVNAGDTLRLGGSLTNSSTPFSGIIDHFRCAETYGFDLFSYFMKSDYAVSIPVTNPCRNLNMQLSVSSVIGFSPNGNFQEFTVQFLNTNGAVVGKALLDNPPYIFMIPDQILPGPHKIAFAWEDPLFASSTIPDSTFPIELGPQTPNPAIVDTNNTMTVQTTGISYAWYELDMISYPYWHDRSVNAQSWTLYQPSMFMSDTYKCIVTKATGCPWQSGNKYLVFNPMSTKSLVNNHKVYPNPTKDFTILETNSPIISYEVQTMEGKIVKKVILNGATSKETIDLTTFLKGIYLVKIETIEGINLTKLAVE